jgi:hypothetical protein
MPVILKIFEEYGIGWSRLKLFDRHKNKLDRYSVKVVSNQFKFHETGRGYSTLNNIEHHFCFSLYTYLKDGFLVLSLFLSIDEIYYCDIFSENPSTVCSLSWVVSTIGEFIDWHWIEHPNLATVVWTPENKF